MFKERDLNKIITGDIEYLQLVIPAHHGLRQEDLDKNEPLNHWVRALFRMTSDEALIRATYRNKALIRVALSNPTILETDHNLVRMANIQYSTFRDVEAVLSSGKRIAENLGILVRCSMRDADGNAFCLSAFAEDLLIGSKADIPKLAARISRSDKYEGEHKSLFSGPKGNEYWAVAERNDIYRFLLWGQPTTPSRQELLNQIRAEIYGNHL